MRGAFAAFSGETTGISDRKRRKILCILKKVMEKVGFLQQISVQAVFGWVCSKKDMREFLHIFFVCFLYQ